MFRQSKLVFDEHLERVDATIRRGALPACGVKRQTIPYRDVGNVAVLPTSVRSNGERLCETVIYLRDSTMIPTGSLEPQGRAFYFASSIHRFIFDRPGMEYVPPTMDELVISQ